MSSSGGCWWDIDVDGTLVAVRTLVIVVPRARPAGGVPPAVSVPTASSE
jgi:hypothetical protein